MGIKYKDPTTGNFKELSVKVGDTLPVGSEVDFNGSTVPTGWEEVEGDKEFFLWTPVLSCQTASEAPTVTYTRQVGTGAKIKITSTLSIVFVSAYIRASITAISSGSNYAAISGLPYTNNGAGCTFNFNDFYSAVDSSHPIPTGYFIGKQINIMNGTRGSSVERWITTNYCEIQGAGFYFTNE